MEENNNLPINEETTEDLPVSESVNSNIIYITDAKLSNPSLIYIDFPRPVKKPSFCLRVGQIVSIICILSIFVILLIIFITHRDEDDEYSNTNSTQYN
jgi:hypothetical protein